MTINDRRKAIQRAIGVTPDGDFGPATLTALERKLGIGPASVPAPPTSFDERSEKNISSLLPTVQPVFRKLLNEANRIAAAYRVTAKIISGTRTYAEQDRLFAKRPKVTNARGGYSNHNFGIAVDLGLFSGDDYLDSSNPRLASEIYSRIAPVARSLGLEWGGDWKSFKDEPHFQYPTGLTLAQMRQRVAAGKPIV